MRRRPWFLGRARLLVLGLLMVSRPFLAVGALGIGAFGIGVTEFAPMGMLPGIAADLGVSIPVAGLLISAYAVGVVLGAPLMTLATARARRRGLLIALMGILAIGNIGSALSSTYGLLLLSRVVTSLCHGAFFGVGAVVAAGLVAPEQRAGAVASMFLGLTIANVGGVPLATWLADALGWHTAFWLIAALGVIAMLALRFALPNVPVEKHSSAAAELRVLITGPVLKALGLTVLGSSAMFTVFTYIAAMLGAVTHASIGFVTVMLMLFGAGMTVGNVWGGRAADRARDRTLLQALSGLVVVLTLLAATLHWPLAAALLIPLWGFMSFAIVPPLQLRVLESAAEAPNLASAMNIGAFNVGNAIGAALGAAVIAAGLGYRAVPLAGAGVAGLALIAAVASRTSETRV